MDIESNYPDWAEVESASGERHLPVYFLLDTTDSMEGPPILSVKDGLEQFQQAVSSDPFVRDTIKVGVITFGSKAKFVSNGLEPITSFQPPNLENSRTTRRLDLAFRILLESIDRDVVKTREGKRKGDWKPVVFILLNGPPSDELGNPTDHLWRHAREKLINREKGQIKIGTIVAVGVGSNVDNNIINAISLGSGFKLENSEGYFASLFNFISQTID
jgi:uncharacterized protein YegL